MLFVHGNKRQHVNRSFKQEQGIPAADPVKAVFRLTAGSVSLEAALCSSAALVNVPWVSLPVCAHEYGVVVICGFIDKTSVGKSIQHLLVDAPVSKQVAVDPAHVLMLSWNLQWFLGKRFYRLPDGTGTHGEHELHRLRVLHVVEPAGKIDSVPAHLFVLVEPQIAPDGHFLPVIQPHILRAGSFHFLPALPQKCRQICSSGLFPLLLRKRYIAHFTSESFLQVRDRDICIICPYRVSNLSYLL